MPFRSRSQVRWMAAAESRGEVPRGTFDKWKSHTEGLTDLPETVKSAYDRGLELAFAQLGLTKGAAETPPPEKPTETSSGKETRLKRNHAPHDFFNVRRSFERADKRTKEVGTHVPVTKAD